MDKEQFQRDIQKADNDSLRAILEPNAIKQCRKCPFYQHFRRSVRYSNSRQTVCHISENH